MSGGIVYVDGAFVVVDTGVRSGPDTISKKECIPTR